MIVSCQNYICLARTNLRNEVVRHTGSGIEGLVVSRQFIPAQKPQHRVFSSPYIPLFHLIFRRIVSNIAVWGLRRDYVRNRFCDFVIKFRISGVTIRAYCSERPFPPKFAVPFPAFDSMTERLHNLINILFHHAMLKTVVNSPSDISVDLH